MALKDAPNVIAHPIPGNVTQEDVRNLPVPPTPERSNTQTLPVPAPPPGTAPAFPPGKPLTLQDGNMPPPPGGWPKPKPNSGPDNPFGVRYPKREEDK